METEIKLGLPDPNEGHRKLFAAGFQIHVERVFERNLVLDDETFTLKNSRRLLRVREAGLKITCTYKGRGTTARHKQREEREFLASSLEEALAVFEGLGYSVKFEYQKYRTEYRRKHQDGIATIDETPIGCFMELEGEGDWIDKTAGELGFTEADYNTDSYGTIYSKWCEAQGKTPGNFVFETP